jgi:hypothetical protein
LGRHSSPGQVSYYRSVLAWFLPWVLIAAVAITAVWIAVDALGRDDLEAASPAASPRPSATVAAEPSVEPEKTKEPKPSPEPEKTRRPDSQIELITQGISVQILNATDDTAADDLMADRLTKLGFEVVSVDSASRTYTRTTVFYSTSSAQEAGEALGARFGWLVEPKPANLSDTVDLHIVVGVDEAG